MTDTDQPHPKVASRRLSPLEMRFLEFDPQLIIAVVMLFDRPENGGPAPSFEDFVGLIERRIYNVPQWRRRLRRVPGDPGPAVWDEVPIDIKYHVRRLVPGAGGNGTTGGGPLTIGDLENLAATEVHSDFDYERPVWRMTFVEEIEGDRFGLVVAAHHVLVDAVGGMAMLAGTIFDLTAEPDLTESAAAPPFSLAPEASPPTAPEFLWNAVSHRVDGAVSLVRSVGRALRGAGQVWNPKTIEDAGRLLSIIAGRQSRPPQPYSLSVPLADEARVLFWDTSLSELRELARGLGATFNDVLLSSLAGGIRHWHLQRDVEPVDMRCGLVVRLGERAARGDSNPTVRVFIDLPVTEEDSLRRIRSVAARTSVFKANEDAELITRVEDAAEQFPEPVRRRLIGLLYHNEFSNLVSLSNFPGVAIPVYMLGAQLAQIFPVVTLTGTYRLGIVATSVMDQACLSCTVDGNVPDADLIADGMKRELHLLSKRQRDLRAVRSVPLFSSVAEKDQLEMASSIEEVGFPAGSSVFEENDHPDYFYILEEGSVEVIEGGQVVRALEAPDFFGEVGLVTGERRSASIRTRTAVTLLRLSRDRFVPLVMEDPVSRRVAEGLVMMAKSGHGGQLDTGR